jgi:hypothetical protein
VVTAVIESARSARSSDCTDPQVHPEGRDGPHPDGPDGLREVDPLEVVPGLVEAEVAVPGLTPDVDAVGGPKGKHDPGRSVVRPGRGHGSVTLGGCQVPVT